MFRIASNELVDVYRADGRQDRAVRSIGAELRSRHEEHTPGMQPDREDLVAALSKIRPRYQRALTLRYFADLTNDEAAAAMGVSRATMAVVVHRAGAALRRAIESEQERVVRNG